MADKRIVDIGLLLETVNESFDKAVLESNVDEARSAAALINMLMDIPVLTKEELYDYVKKEYIKSWKS
jgi:hypothetical protein